MADWQVVTTGAELVAAIDAGSEAIEVRGAVAGMPMVTLPPGTRLRGGTLRFGGKGLRLTRDNDVEGVTVLCPDYEVAILNDTTVANFGRLWLKDVRVAGQVLLLAQDAVQAGYLKVHGLTVLSADLRGRVDRPRGFGVEALQGAFTVWNRQLDPEAVINAELLDISAGSVDSPVRGSGVFVGGHGGDGDGLPEGGSVQVSTLRTGQIHTDGGIPAGTPDLISGGVFVISGAVVEEVVNTGPVTTYGPNDMVLDNWGDVTTWTATAPITSRGPSGIGFVNFGRLDHLKVRAPIETFGTGARGFNVYEGSLRRASFESIATHGDGSVGVQVSKPLSVLEIAGDLTTEGGTGQSLVKGVQVTLKATALSVKPGGEVGTLTVGGRVRTTGDDVVSVEIDGKVDHLHIAGGVTAEGQNSDAIHLGAHGPDVSGITVTATHGRTVVNT